MRWTYLILGKGYFFDGKGTALSFDKLGEYIKLKGLSFIDDIDGSFLLLILDTNRNVSYFITDPKASIPLYYSFKNNINGNYK